MNFLTIIYVVAGVVFLFGAAVFVHEFGHFWVARKRGMKVEAFAIGFGPKIFGWTRDGIEYSVRWIPAGGFVKLPQMITSEAIEGKDEQAKALPPADPLSKILVAFAGPFMNVVFAFAIATLIYFVGLPEAVNPSIIGYVDPESEEYAVGIREGNEIVSVQGEKVATWHEVQMAAALARTNILDVGIQQKDEVKHFSLKAEVNDVIGLKVLNLASRDTVIIAQVMEGSPAEEAGLQNEDKVLEFSEVPIHSYEQLISLIGKSANESHPLKIERQGQILTLPITPELDETVQKGRIGVQLTSPPPVYIVKTPGPTPVALVHEVWDQTIKTLGALFHSKETGVSAKDLSGPVGILSVLAIQVKTDYRLALKFLVLLNINLAILNLLPLPVLDGGHIVMSLYEMITRRPVSPRIQEYTTSAFAILLISFMLYVTYHDIDRIPLFKSLFNDPGTVEQSSPEEPEPSTP